MAPGPLPKAVPLTGTPALCLKKNGGTLKEFCYGWGQRNEVTGEWLTGGSL